MKAILALVTLFVTSANVQAYSSRETKVGVEYRTLFFEKAFQSQQGEKDALALLERVALDQPIETRTCHHLICRRYRTAFSFAVASTPAVFDRALQMYQTNYQKFEYDRLVGHTYWSTNVFFDLIESKASSNLSDSEFVRRMRALLISDLMSPYRVWGTYYTDKRGLLFELLRNNLRPEVIFGIFEGTNWNLMRDVNYVMASFEKLEDMPRQSIYGAIARYQYLDRSFLEKMEALGLVRWDRMNEAGVNFSGSTQMIRFSPSDIFALVAASASASVAKSAGDAAAGSAVDTVPRSAGDTVTRSAGVLAPVRSRAMGPSVHLGVAAWTASVNSPRAPVYDPAKFRDIYLFLVKDRGVRSAQKEGFQAMLSELNAPEWLIHLIE